MAHSIFFFVNKTKSIDLEQTTAAWLTLTAGFSPMIKRLLLFPAWLVRHYPFGWPGRFFRSRALIYKLSLRAIAQARAENNPESDDIIGMLASLYNEDGTPMIADEQILAEATTLQFAGRDTTSLLLSWTLVNYFFIYF